VNPAAEVGVSTITDHPFHARGAWWDLCAECHLGAPAHAYSATFLAPAHREHYRCPDCVTSGEPVCTHRRP